jgi:WG containing repeat
MTSLLRPLSIAFVATIAFACSSDYSIWIPRTKTAEPLYRFEKNDRAGYIDRDGHVVIPPKLPLIGNYGSEFHDGLLEIGVNGGRYVDRTGEVVLDKHLYRGWDFSEGLAVAMRQGENLWGYINTSGEFVISPRFETGADSYVWPFSDGLAKIKVHGKYGYIDHSGKFAIPPQFPDGVDFTDGMARVVTDGPCVYFPEGGCGPMNPQMVGGGSAAPCKFTFIDNTGRAITANRYDNARDFSEGLAPVQIGKLWAFIDKTGRLEIPPRFEDAQPFRSGLARVRDHIWYGYADKSGKIAILPQWTYAEDFSEGFAVVGNSPAGSFWYTDNDGQRAFLGDFRAASPFFKGLAHIRLSPSDAAKAHAESAYIDTTGQRVFTY